MAGQGEAVPIRAIANGPLTGEAQIPGDKSVSHRALILGALAVGETRISGLLEGEDVIDTGKAMRAFGATVERHGPGEWSVHGVGVGGFREPQGVIDFGNSGTGVRLVMGAMATSNVTATFTGDASLCSRPMGRIIDPLALFGARAHGRKGGFLPITLVGAENPVPVRYVTPMPSAQVKSAVLLAGLNAPGTTIVTEREPTRDHTERMLAGFGARIETEVTPEGRVIRLQGHPELRPQRVSVPRDPSSAAFPVAAALIVEGSAITVPAETVQVVINDSGQVFARFQDQVELQELGQLTLANFANEVGLLPLGENLFAESAASGAAVLGVPGDPGFGTLRQGYLESSNVDPVREITSLIAAQRGYEMNSKVIQAADDMAATVSKNLR